MQETIPIYVASLGQRNLELTGELADGWLPIWTHRDRLPEVMAPLTAAASAAGRPADAVTTAPQILSCASDDPETVAGAIRQARAHMAFYIGGMGRYYHDLFCRYGYVAEADAVQRAWAEGDRAGAAAVITDEMVDSITAIGSPDECRRKMAAFPGQRGRYAHRRFPPRRPPEHHARHPGRAGARPAGPGVTLKIGLISDTHSAGSGWDLPAIVLNALTGCDLLLHCGDLECIGVLDCLEQVAPVLAVRGYEDPREPGHRLADTTRVVNVAGIRIGMVHDIQWPPPPIMTTPDGMGLVYPDGELAPVLTRKFGEPVDVVAFGDTHEELVEWRDGALFVNPGSPTYPGRRHSPGSPGTVAILEISGKSVSARIVSLAGDTV